MWHAAAVIYSFHLKLLLDKLPKSSKHKPTLFSLRNSLILFFSGIFLLNMWHLNSLIPRQTVCSCFPKAQGRSELCKVTFGTFDDIKRQKCFNRWIPLKKAVMLYLTVCKPTCFKCYRPSFTMLQNFTIHVNILDKHTIDLIINTFQYLFDFFFPL